MDIRILSNRAKHYQARTAGARLLGGSAGGALLGGRSPPTTGKQQAPRLHQKQKTPRRHGEESFVLVEVGNTGRQRLSVSQ